MDNLEMRLSYVCAKVLEWVNQTAKDTWFHCHGADILCRMITDQPLHSTKHNQLTELHQSSDSIDRCLPHTWVQVLKQANKVINSTYLQYLGPGILCCMISPCTVQSITNLPNCTKVVMVLTDACRTPESRSWSKPIRRSIAPICNIPDR
jgi:hypothetical protein